MPNKIGSSDEGIESFVRNFSFGKITYIMQLSFLYGLPALGAAGALLYAY